MKLVNPEGEKTVVVKAGESLLLELEDFDSGSRDFDLTVELQGENAECQIRGRASSMGSDKKVWKIKQNFIGSEQVGNIDLRGTAEQESFLQFDAAANLKNSSVDADASISERIILFGDAKGKLLPVLRVETDKVKSASHGASIAPVEKEKILYLLSRGIGRVEAEKLLKEGFLK